MQLRMLDIKIPIFGWRGLSFSTAFDFASSYSNVSFSIFTFLVLNMNADPMKTILVALVWLVIAAPQADAKTRRHVSLTYNIAIPISSTRDINTKVSPFGVSLNTGVYLAESWRVGATIGWQHFRDELSDPTEFDGETLTGNQRHRTDAFPFLIGGHYFMEARPAFLHPFIGFYLGGFSI